jgi:DNA mismatch repair ATPase MutS
MINSDTQSYPDLTLFPHSSRLHSAVIDRRYWNTRTAFDQHLEHKKLIERLSRLAPKHNFNLTTLIEHYETDPNKIRTWQSTSQEVIRNPNLQDACAKVYQIDTIGKRTDDSDEFSRSPFQIFLEYEQNVTRLKSALEQSTIHTPYFAQLQTQMQKEYDTIQEAKEQAKTEYSARIELKGILKRDKDRKYHSRSKTDPKYELTILPQSHIQAFESEHKLIFEKKLQRKTDKLTIFDQYVRHDETKKSLVELINTEFQKRGLHFNEDEEIKFDTIIDIQQKSMATYKAQTLITIQYNNTTIEIKQTQGQGLATPFIFALRSNEKRQTEKLYEPFIAKAEEFNPVFKDLQTLATHAQVSAELLKLGATYTKIEDVKDEPATHIYYPHMRPPLRVLKKKRAVANKVESKTGENIAILTGSNKNGKTTYPISIAQNTMLDQAGLPSFGGKGSTLIPRENILCVFANYYGSDEDEESRYSGECKYTRQILEKLTSNSLVILDEIGTGTDTDEAKQTIEEVIQSLATRQSIDVFTTTHFKDMAQKICLNHDNIQGLAFELGHNNQRTYKAKTGVAKTSSGSITAKRSGLGKENLRKVVNNWDKQKIK